MLMDDGGYWCRGMGCTKSASVQEGSCLGRSIDWGEGMLAEWTCCS